MQLEALRIYLAIEPVDMRLGIDGLSRLAQDHLEQNIGNGCCYVFSNRSRNRLKALLWDPNVPAKELLPSKALLALPGSMV